MLKQLASQVSQIDSNGYANQISLVNFGERLVSSTPDKRSAAVHLCCCSFLLSGGSFIWQNSLETSFPPFGGCDRTEASRGQAELYKKRGPPLLFLNTKRKFSGFSLDRCWCWRSLEKLEVRSSFIFHLRQDPFFEMTQPMFGEKKISMAASGASKSRQIWTKLTRLSQ